MLTLYCRRWKNVPSMLVLRHSVSPRRQSDGIRRTHFPFRRLAFALSAQLVILGVTGDLAQAEDPPLGQILSACRVPPRAALGEIRKESPESKKGYTFILAATPFKFTGAYDRAIEQIDQAIKLD